MTNPRFTLRGLFAVVTVVAIGCAALANPTDLWASVVFSGTLGLLVIALLMAVVRRGTARAGAIGFALCGCAYLGLILAPGDYSHMVNQQRIGHSLFALLFAIVGSVVARWLYRGSDVSEEKLTPPEAGTPS